MENKKSERHLEEGKRVSDSDTALTCSTIPKRGERASNARLPEIASKRER